MTSEPMRASAELLASAILAESRSSLIDMASTIPSIRPFEKKKVFPKKVLFYSFGCTPILQDEKIFCVFDLKSSFATERTLSYGDKTPPQPSDIPDLSRLSVFRSNKENQ